MEAQDRVLSVNGTVDTDTTGRFTDMLLDPDHTLTIEGAVRPSASFAPITTRKPDAGYTDAMVWLRLSIENKTDDTSDWRLYFKENFKQIFHVYIRDAQGNITHPLAQDRASGFSSRPIAHPEIVVPLDLPPGDVATIYVRYWTEGSTYLPIQLETVETFNQIATRNAAKQFIFYGMMVILIFAAILAGLALRHPIFPAYIGYSACTLLYIMHSDGVAFQYLWPNVPAFNSYASVVFGGGYALFAAIYARLFLNTAKHHSVVDKLLIGVIFVLVTMIVVGPFTDPSAVKQYIILVVLFSVGLFTLAALLAARKRFRQVRFYVFAWLGATVSAGLMTIRHWFGVEISQEFQYDSMRFVMIFDAIMMGLAIVDRYHQLREERQAAMQASLDQAQRNLDINNRLRNLEARYELALESTAQRDERIENTVHDLRQPLHALRLAVQSAVQDKPKSDQTIYKDIYDSFDYVEALVAEYMTEPVQPQTMSDMQLDDILSSIHEMFLPDASEKGLRFTYVKTSITAPFQPLAVMRMVSNLVSNAIKYTPHGKVLLGVRGHKSSIHIEVHDTGDGMTNEQFQAASKRGARLEKTLSLADGQGHGLSILSELAQENGYEVKLLQRQTKGTSIAIAIPMVDSTKALSAA